MQITERRLLTREGVELVYHGFGQGPPVVLANGLGGTFRSFAPLCAPLLGRYRFLSWDYRGLYRSSPPPDLEGYAIHRQAQDLWAILDAEEISQAVLVGWSMGVQVSLEAYRQAPERVLGLVALNGTFGTPFSHAPHLAPLQVLLPIFLERAEAILPRLEPIFHRTIDWRYTIRLAKLLGVVAREADEDSFYEVMSELIALDLRGLLKNLIALNHHDARDLLPTIQIPALVITGSKDRMTPPAAAKHMAEQIPNSQFMEVIGGTHYAPLEFPRLVGRRLEEFLFKLVGRS